MTSDIGQILHLLQKSQRKEDRDYQHLQQTAVVTLETGQVTPPNCSYDATDSKTVSPVRGSRSSSVLPPVVESKAETSAFKALSTQGSLDSTRFDTSSFYNIPQSIKKKNQPVIDL